MSAQDFLQIGVVHRGLIPEEPDAQSVLVAAGLHSHRDQVFRAKDSCRGLLIQALPRLLQRLLQQGVVGRQELNRHPVNIDALPLLHVAPRAQRFVQGCRGEQPAGRLGQHHDDGEIEGQHRFRVERRTHGTCDRVAPEDALSLKRIEDVQRLFHPRRTVSRPWAWTWDRQGP